METLDMILDIDDGHYWEKTWNETPEKIEETWDNTLTDVREWVKAYYKAVSERDSNPENCLNLVLPQYWQIVRALNISRWGVGSLPSDSHYDIGILLVGFSSLPIALSIAEIQPCQKIYFLHSEDTLERCNEITDRIEEMLDPPPPPFSPLISSDDATALIARVRCAERREIADSSDPVSTFKQIKDIIDEVEGTVKIALDLTGGKKTMIGGGFTAGSIYSVAPKCDMFYVDSRKYDSRQGTPIPGTEFLSRLENPYDVYNVQSVGQVKELFKRHNYEAAERLWKTVRNKLYRPDTRYDFLVNEREEAKKYYGSSYCYNPWDAFDYKRAVERKTYGIDKIIYSWGYDEQHVRRITDDRSIDVLNILATVTNKSTLYANERRVIHYAVDRYQNGMRRKQSGKLEDTLVRFTQVIEMLCNYRVYQLAKSGKIVNQSGSSGPVSPDTPWELTPLIRLLFGSQVINLKGTNYWVSKDSLLSPEDYGYRTVDEITKLIQPRNDFIHFNSPMGLDRTKKNVDSLRQLSLEFLRKFSGDYCCTNRLNFRDLLELHKFRR